MTGSAADTIGGGPRLTLPPWLAAARRALAAIGRVELTLAIIALVVVVVLSGSQAFLRYLFGTSLWWAQEVAENTILVAYFLGISYVYKASQDIVVDFVSLLMPMRVQLFFYLLAQVLTAVFCAVTVWLIYTFVPTLLDMRTPVLSLPAVLTPAPLALASAMMVLTSLYYLVFAAWALIRGPVGTTLADIEAVALILQPLEEANW